MARGLQIALLVVGSGLCGSIYVVCPPMLGEFTPVSQRGAVIAIYGAIYTLAGILAPSVMGSVIQRSGGLLEGYMTGFTINAVVLIASGLLGLLLLWPNTERARLMGPGNGAAEIRVNGALPPVPRPRGSRRAALPRSSP